MTFLPTFKNIDLFGKTVLVRSDLNVPFHNGVVADKTRLLVIKKTVRYLMEQQAKVLLLSHFGRPLAYRNKSCWDLSYSLKNLVAPLEQVLETRIEFVGDYAGSMVQKALALISPGTVLLLENIRFDPGEETNDTNLAIQLAEGVDLYVNEAFSCSHRAHASVDAITRYLPSVAGFHFQEEVHNLEKFLNPSKRPVVSIIGGSKVSTKLGLLKNLSQKVDGLIIGGGMANTFLAARGMSIGDSFVESGLLLTAQEILKTSKAKIILPEDVVVASDLTDSKGTVLPCTAVTKGQKIFDIGPDTINTITSLLNSASTILWNGPVGAFEHAAFASGTVAIAKAVGACTKQGILTIAGGGDTLSALKMAEVSGCLSYISTAGGAFLEWLEGRKLPGVQALQKQYQFS